MTCSSCGLDKELTRHGTCFKCHVSGLQVSKRCKNCRSTQSIIDEHRVSQKITITKTTQEIE